MNIAFVLEALPYLPSRDGFRLYAANLIRCLARYHRIDLISLLREGDEQHLDWARDHCASVTTIRTQHASLPFRVVSLVSSYLWGRPLHFRAQLGAILRAGLQSRRWDLLHVEGAFIGGLISAGVPLAKVLSLHDSWTLRYGELLKCSRSLGEKLRYTLLRRYEPRFERLVYPRFDFCVVVAQRDLEAVRVTVPNCNVICIPSGTDAEYFRPLPVEKQEATLAFHGHLGYAPNEEAALEFANEIFPLIQREVPASTFQLIGASPSPKIKELVTRPGIKLFADLPDLRSVVCSANIYVCPIRYGTGLKNKMLEAMAMGLPVVCYPAATAGLEVVDGQHLGVARTRREFAQEVIGLLRQPDNASRLAAAARQLVEEKYSWERSARAFEELYLQLLKARAAPPHNNHGAPIP